MSAPTENTASAAGPPVDLYDPAFLTTMLFHEIVDQTLPQC